MAKLHGRFAPITSDRSSDPGADPTTPGFKVTRRGPGVERFDPKPSRTPEQPDFQAIVAARASARAAQKAAHAAASRADVVARVAARAAKRAAPDLDHLKRENAIPATPPKPNAEPRTVTVNTDDYTPEQRAKARDEYRAWKRSRNIKDAVAAADPMLAERYNESLHKVKTPGGLAKYHAERQRTALEMAKDLKGKDREFALVLAKEHGAAKRSAGGGAGQKRVPAGQSTGGRWTK